MRHLFVEPGGLSGDELRIGGLDHHHLANVLRIRPGEVVQLQDGEGARLAAVCRVEARATVLALGDVVAPPGRPGLKITIAQAIGKGTRFEEALEHSTEAGAAAFIPLVTSRTVVRIAAADVPVRLERWGRILKGAAEQAGRDRIPTIVAPIDWAAFVRIPCEPLIAAPGSVTSLADAVRVRTSRKSAELTVVIGPEGGLAEEEIALAEAVGGARVGLGEFVYRTETAGVAAIAIALTVAGNHQACAAR